MKNTIIVAIVILFLLFSTIIAYTFTDRYYLQVTSEGHAFKIDKITGKTWVIYPNGNIQLTETTEEKAKKIEKIFNDFKNN